MNTPAPDGRGRVLVLAGPGFSTAIVAGTLARAFGDVRVVRERRPARRAQLKARFARYGAREAIGQLLFKAVSPLLALRQRRRADVLRTALQAAAGPMPPVVDVVSANSPAAHEAIRAFAPAVVVVCGTRILTRKTLRTAPLFLNLHAGITPAYRGVHGGYWALAEGDAGNVGATVHVVDPGVDTGTVIAHVRVAPTADDGFFTLPLLQLQAGLPALVAAVGEALGPGLCPADPSPGASRQWAHPTLWRYLSNGVRRDVW